MVPDLHWNGIDDQGTCPSCHQPTFHILRYGPNEGEPSCKQCSKTELEAAAERVFSGGPGDASPNGAVPVPGASVASVASVAADKQKSSQERIVLQPEAFYGLPGMAVELILPHTEADPAALLANFITAAGCIVGPRAYIYRDGRRQGTNEFACVVGLSAAARKGTATSRIEEVIKDCVGSIYTKIDHVHACESDDAAWEDLIIRGLGSGEALVSSLAEDANEAGWDGRRFVFEEEFSRCLKVMGREGSTLSEMLRAVWDGSRLENRVKGKTLRAPAGHVSLMGHITEAEMRVRLGQIELFNGFANRFLWFLADRSKYLPLGGGHPPVGPVVSGLRHVLEQSRHWREMTFDGQVTALWVEGGLYQRLEDRPPGLLGAVTARAAAHVTRLSLLWAVLDGAEQVHLPHLMAALAVWDYNEKTCAYLFGTSTGDEYADSILEFLQEVAPGYLTRTEIRDRFKRHAEPGRIMQALLLLEREGKIERHQVSTPGRSAECWSLKTSDPRDRSDKSDKSPLEWARGLL